MGGSSSKSKNKSRNNSQSSYKTNVWNTQGDALANLYNQGSDIFGNVMQQGLDNQHIADDWMADVRNEAMPAWQNQLDGGVFSDMNLGTNLMQSLNNSMGAPSAVQDINRMIMGGEGNDYADAMKGQMMNDAGTSLDGVLARLDQRAANSGMSGGSRHGMAQAGAIDSAMSGLQDNLTKVGYNTFDKDLNRKMQIANMADQGTLARQNMMMNMLGQQQAQQNLGFGNIDAVEGVGTNYMNTGNDMFKPAFNLANLIGNPTLVGSGTGSSGGGSSGKSKSLGAQL